MALRHAAGPAGLRRTTGRHPRHRPDQDGHHRTRGPADRFPALQLRRPRRLRTRHAPGLRPRVRAAPRPVRPGELRPSRRGRQFRHPLPRRPGPRRLGGAGGPHAGRRGRGEGLLRGRGRLRPGLRRGRRRAPPRVGTAEAARDLDLLRHALGDRTLHYFGMSYGTQLGAAYAHQFPGRAGRLVLDAAVDPEADMIGHARNQTIGFQRALDNYLRSEGRDPRQGSREIAALLKRIDRQPLPTASDRKLTESHALTGIVNTLYSELS
ncbi:alpha/beta fold hydrolase [Actinomadura keratinilytica]